MSLPNFMNFEPFNRLRRKMHTDQLGRFDLDSCRACVPGYTQRPRSQAERPAAAGGNAESAQAAAQPADTG